ncbi:MAG: HPP family protein, partial [Elusimicrobiota bacterium]
MKAKDIMTTNLITVKKDYTITRMIKILQDNNITGAPVVDGQDNLIGIVSIKDIIQAVSDLIKVHLSVEKIKEMRGKYNWVEGIMSTDVITADVNEEVLD